MQQTVGRSSRASTDETGATDLVATADPAPVLRLVEGDDGILVVTLDRPATRNALSHEVLEGLHSVLGDVGGARAVVLTGGDRVFCAGGDLGAVHRALDDGDREAVTVMLELLNDVVRRLRRLSVPTVAAVEGAAVGAGLALAMATDLRVVGRRAAFIPGYLAVGASPDGGASYHLARALGPHAALAAFVLNRRIRSDELLAAGVVQEVVDDGRAFDAATALAARVAGVSPAALVATRRLIDVATTHDLEHHLDAEGRAFSALWDTADFRQAISAYAGRDDG
jgi:2-(1,2-epoxy-1,2-dihydrophenyl)acetyl-CoA isomerase